MSNKKNQYSWDLEKILENQTIEELIQNYYDLQNQIIHLLENNPFESLEKIKKFHQKDLEISIVSNRLSNYLSNHMNCDLSNTKYFAISQEIENKSINYYQKMSKLDNLIYKNKSKINEYLKDKEFKQFKRIYIQIFARKKHDLKKEIKSFCATYAPLNSSYYQLFTLIFDKELKIEDAKDAKNKKHPVENYSDYLKYLKHNDRTLRKNVFINWVNAIYSFRETFARLIYYNYLELNIDAKNHKFPKGYYQSVIFDDEIKEKFVPKIYKEIEKWKHLVSKYKKINKKILKTNHSLENVKPWDLYLPLWKDEKEYSIEEAKEIIVDSLSILGDDYVKLLKESLNNSSIDWLPGKNKISGAYCIGGCYGLKNKYVFLNYDQKFESISTLAHELGHAIHAIKFCESQDHHASTTIFVAEIPSILNEILLNYYFLEKYKKENNKKKELEIYDHLISNFISTTTSQIIFSSWEFEISDMVSNGIAIDANLAEKIYLEKLKKFTNLKEKKLTDLDKKNLSKILTVPHFYSGNFYVYKYCIGHVVALLLAEKIKNLETKKDALKKFDLFLRAGSSKSNLETISILEIDLLKSETWKIGKQIFESWLNRYQELFSEIYIEKK